MKLENLTGEYEDRRILMYSKNDGNTVVRHNKSMRKIAENVYAGNPDECDYSDCCDIYIMFDDVKYGVRIFAVSKETEVDSVLENLRRDKLDTKDGFAEWAEGIMKSGRFVKLLLMEFVGQFKPELVPDMMKAREVYKEKMEQERAEERAQEEAEDAEFVRSENEKTDKMVAAAEEVLRKGGYLRNDTITVYRSRYDSSDYSIVNYLFRKYGVKCPIKTQGWVNSSLVRLTIDDGRCEHLNYRQQNKQSKCSQKIFECVNELIAAVNAV